MSPEQYELQTLYDQMRFAEQLPNLSLIVAADMRGTIGKDNGLPWKRLKGDLPRFKRLTEGKKVILGRKTLQSFPSLLINRQHLVITRNPDLYDPIEDQLNFISSVDEALEIVKQTEEEVFVIGGAEIYNQTLPYVTRVYLTRALDYYEGDTRVPAFSYHSSILNDLFSVESKESVFCEEKSRVTHIYKNLKRKY